MKPKIYVDGQEGTTGLRIHQILAARQDLQVLRIDEARRKETAERRRLLNAADIAFLCLPEAASREAVALIDAGNTRTRIIDASTAFRTDPQWAYGLPELSPAHRQKLKTAPRIANPGCHASAFLLGVYPLVAAGILPREAVLTCVSLTGYSGAGRKMIEAYEAPDRPDKLDAPRPYALKLRHKHVPEMRVIAGLTHAPLFTPVICDVHSGMAVETFLPAGILARPVSPAEVHGILARHYQGEHFVRVMPLDLDAHLDEGFLDITTCNGTNQADVFVFGHDQQMAVVVRLDNLGKGASGAAIQCMNLALGVPEATGLDS